MDKYTAKATMKDMNNVYFAVVDQFVEMRTADGSVELKVKTPIFREKIFTINDAAGKDVTSGVAFPAKVIKEVCDIFTGVYRPINTKQNPKDAERRINIMLAMTEDPTKPIIGPYPSHQEAVKAQLKLRDPTPTEVVTKLTVENKEKSEELDKLRAQIADLEAGKKPEKPKAV